MAELKLGFLGAGKMAGALAKGFIKAGLASTAGIVASDPVAQARSHFSSETGAASVGTNSDVARFSKLLVLAVKPDQVGAVLKEISPQFTTEHTLLSIAAGVPLARLEAGLPAPARVVRVMPNTPALVGASATGFALGKHAQAADAELTQRLFASVGIVYEVKESLLDAVTGLSGSGPAYVFLMIEALSDGGVAAGLPREVATRLAAQTVLGSARMVLESGVHPSVLRDMVTSPGGTTIEGLHELERAGMRGAFMSAVRAAADKSKRLGQA